MPLDAIDPYPWYLNKTLDLAVNDLSVHARFTSSQWTEYWRPLLAQLHDRWQNNHKKRFLIAIAGPPGSGKSVLAQQLQWLIEHGALHGDAHSVALPMDGFHYSNAYLQSHARPLPDGSRIPLSSVKGQPDTFDIQSLRQHIHDLTAHHAEVHWPGYSRHTHDVVPGKFHIPTGVNIIIIEGSYLLLNRGPFTGIPALFDLRIYVDVPAPIIISNLIERHTRGGRQLDQAKDWVKRIDLPNARIAESTKHHADLIIERESNDELSDLIWQTPRNSPQAPAATPIPPDISPPIA